MQKLCNVVTGRSTSGARTEWPRLSGKEEVILRLLVSKGEQFGLQMVENSNGELKRGSIYVLLDRMEDKGFVESWQEEKAPGAIGLPRRRYRVTGHGVRVLSGLDHAVAIPLADPEPA